MKRKDEKREDECPQCQAVQYGAPLMCSKTRIVTQWRREHGCLTRTVSGGMCVKWENTQ